MNTIRIYSPEFVLLHEFEDFISCKEQRNYAETSTLSLSVDPNSTAAPYLLDGFYVCIDKWFYIIRDRIADSSRVSVVGYSPFRLLQQRVANEQTVNGSVDSMAKTLITANTQGNRSLPIVCAAADNSGTQHTWTTESNRVNYEIEDMLKLDDSGIKTDFNGSGFTFDTYHGTDRSTENTEGNEPVIFAVKYDNLLSFSHETGNVDTVNVVYVHDDEGNVTEYDPDTASGVNRFESTGRLTVTEGDSPPRLPTGFIELTSIKSTGTQMINSGIAYTAENYNKIRFESDVNFDNASGVYEVNGTGTSGANCFYVGNLNGTLIYGDGKTDSTTNIKASGRNTYIIDGQKGIVSVSGVGENSFSPKVPSVSANLLLFGFNRTSGNPTGHSETRYSCKIYIDNVLVCHLIPCIDPSGAIGMYNLITNAFHGNVGTGEFIAGETIQNNFSLLSTEMVKPRNAIISTIAPYTFAYGADYFLGDIVTIEHKSMEAVKHGDEYDIAEITRRHTVRITSMAIDYTADTVTYTPTFGTVQRNLRTIIKKQQKDITANQTAINTINKRITALEAAI